jgi:DNA-binding transcriptional LysR family regulator
MFNLRQLRYFVAVADSLSFTRAAQNLHISQPPLSQQIRALEEDLGVRLLDRTKRRVRLTEPGRLFLDEARKLLAQAESARVTVSQAAAGYGGRLRLGYPVSVAFHRALPRALLEFARIAPGVQVELNELYTSAQYESLLAGQIDVGFVRAQPAQTLASRELLHIRELDRERMLLALPAAHPLARRDALSMCELVDTPFVAQPARYGTTLYDALMTLTSRAGFHPAIVQEARQVTGLLALVSAGIGVALVPASLKAVKLEAVRLVELSDDDAFLMLGLATRSDQHSPVLDRFLDMIDGLHGLVGDPPG